MIIYYVLFVDEKRLDYLEVEEETTEEEIKSILEGIDEKIEVYKNCCNFGPFDLLFKNY